MKKEIDRHRNKGWWQGLSASSKALFIVGIVLVAVVLLVYYFVSMAGSPETVAKVMVTVCVLETFFMVAVAMTCISINTASMNEVKDKAIEMMKAEITQAEKFYLDSLDDSLKIISLDDLEDLEDAKQPPTTPPPPAQLSAEQIAALWKESESYDPEADANNIVERRYKRAEERLRSGDIDKEKASPHDSVTKKASRASGVTVAFPVKECTSVPETKTNPDPPEKEPLVPSIEAQLDELHLPRTAATFLRYLLQVGKCEYYGDLSLALRGQLDSLARIDAS